MAMHPKLECELELRGLPPVPINLLELSRFYTGYTLDDTKNCMLS